MKAIAQNEIISLLQDLNAFADRAEAMINSVQNANKQQNAQIEKALQDTRTAYDQECNKQVAAIREQSNKTFTDAEKIRQDIESLDHKLCTLDKYYVKTRNRRAEILAGMTSEKYASATDYFSAMDQIRKDYTLLTSRYTSDILPGLINGLNYLFSSKRKKDYEELIILKNTVDSFVQEMRQVLPQVTTERITELRKWREEGFKKAQTDHDQAVQRQYQIYNAAIDHTAGQIYDDLDAILPDELVQYLSTMVSHYAGNVYKVNTTKEVQDEVLNMSFVDYPVDQMVSSPVVASVIKQKCEPLLSGSDIRFPIMMSVTDAPTWLIQNDRSNTSAVQSFMHSIMFGVLSACPVAKLCFRVADPENRGNSVSPFFDARKKLPELFGDKFLVNRDEITQEINRLNDKIGSILQDRLGNQYDNIFEYAKANPDYSVDAEFLLLFDFPKGFDERTLGELRNILRNGSRCGIYVLISYLPADTSDASREFQQNLLEVVSLSVTVQQNEQDFLYRGLPLAYYPMPEKGDFAKFFSKYMLIYEGIQNRGIAFSPLIRKLADAENMTELSEQFAAIDAMTAAYRESYGKTPDVKAGFPEMITLGSVLYPADIFSDSVGFDKIVEHFGVEKRGSTENSSFVELPLTFDLRNSFNLLLESPEQNKEEMRRFTHHVIWSLLSYLPVTKVNVCIFDSEQRGNSVIPFLDFRKKSPDTFDQKIYTSQEAMTDRLRALNGQIDDFIQEKLGNRYQSFLDYNINTPNRAEPVTLLVLYDFPAGMDGRSVDLLNNILRNGSKCGVFVLICHDPAAAYSRYDNIDERIEQMRKYCVSMDYKDGHYEMLPYNLQINVPAPVSGEAAERFIREYAEKSETIKKKGFSFRDILKDELFSMDSAKVLRIPVGVGDGDSLVSITFGEGSSHHGLIAGATGSGKSTFLHTLIMSAMLNYTPDQLHLYLMDFKSGTEFKVYESVPLPHIQLLALDAMQEFGESILEKLVSEMEDRGALFKEAGTTSLNGYRDITGKTLPRILVIMDEFQILFNDAGNRKVAMNCAELTKRIVTEGRAFGIHLLMATQSTKVISDLTLSRGTIEQMRIRIGMKCGEDDARYLFSDQNDQKALTMMKGPIGTAVMNLDYTEQQNIGFRAAYCDAKTQRELLEEISSRFADVPAKLQTFEGARTTGLLDYFAEAGIGRTDELPVKIHMGELIKVAPPFAITIDRKRRHNLLICGANERMSNMLANEYMVSAILNTNARVYCIDGDKLVGDDLSEDFYEVLSSATSRFKAAEDRGDIIRFVNEIYKEYQRFKKQSAGEVIFVVIKNLQFLDLVMSMFKNEYVDAGEYLEEEPESIETPELDPTNPFAAVTSFFESRNNNAAEDTDVPVNEKMQKLIADGSGFGIHFIVTSMEYTSVRESMYYGENILARFPERIIFSLGENDADSLVENVSVSGLRDNTVYFTDGIRNTFQLKPYVLPRNDRLKAFFDKISE